MDSQQYTSLFREVRIRSINFDENIHPFKTNTIIVCYPCSVGAEILYYMSIRHILCDILQSVKDVGSNIVVGV